MRRQDSSLRALFLSAVLISTSFSATGSEVNTEEPLSLTEILAGGSTEGYARATQPRLFRFPADHGSHDEFRTEWWYFTGNLTTAGGRRFGYQYTLFRSALASETPQRDSDWATRQVFMAHFTITDPEDGVFLAFERFSRGAAELAGVTSQPFRAWLEDWEIRGGDTPQSFQLDVEEGGTALELKLESGKPMVLHGNRGLSQKGRQPGNASHYYSLTRMPTRGTVTLGYKTFEVQGSSWLDREWSTSALEEGQAGWDWFAIQLSDGKDLMVYNLRRADGSSDGYSSGTVVDSDGQSRSLKRDDFTVQVLDSWTSPATDIRYPAKWRLKVPEEDLDLEITPLLPDQELNLSFRYWEGAVSVKGSSTGDSVTGQGYVELTGYE